MGQSALEIGAGIAAADGLAGCGEVDIAQVDQFHDAAFVARGIAERGGAPRSMS
jgi:hypothetical protein